MATVAASPAAVPATPAVDPGGVVVLPEVSWELYCQLRDAEGNDHVRMTYLDGELTLMSPALRHDEPAILLTQVVRALATVEGREIRSVGTTTLRRAEAKGGPAAGKEPDAAFYLDADELRMRGRKDLDLEVDPPPTLAIEVDSSRDSTSSLSIYARLGVPEVWRHSTSTRTTWIGRLDGNVYWPVERSVAFPRLTPDLIRQALDRLEVGDLGEIAWFEWLKGWARAQPAPPA